MSRSNSLRRRFVALLALLSVLFAQTALAWYQCPGESVAVAVEAASSDDSSARPAQDCGEMDPAQPGLCRAHVLATPQSLDKPHAPDVPALGIVLLAVAEDRCEPTLAPQTSHGDRLPLKRATAPPISIRNCCLRI